jgi:hypothetical protein
LSYPIKAVEGHYLLEVISKNLAAHEDAEAVLANPAMART